MISTIFRYQINNIVKFGENEIFKGFKGPVNSIIQSTSTFNILVSCNDGKISLLSKINLELYGKDLNFD